jgi:hypothetical protein
MKEADAVAWDELQAQSLLYSGITTVSQRGQTASTPYRINVAIVASASTLPDNKPRNRHERRAQAAKGGRK